MKIEFKNVGRWNKCWMSECKAFTYDWMYSQVKNHAYIMSNDLDFVNGKIYANFHKIGEYEITEDGE